MTLTAPLLAIDIGNTRIKFGVFAHGLTAADQLPVCQRVIAVPANEAASPWDQVEAALPDDKPRCIIASVNPPVLERLLEQWSHTGWGEPVIVRGYAQLPIANHTVPPNQTGMDRLLKGVAGNAIRSPGQPLILVDSGTATTVDWVTENGAFAGGTILPGLGLASRALHEHTAQLPLIDAEQFDQLRPAVIGTNTVAALQSGLYWGHIGAVREIISGMASGHAGPHPRVLFTGGAGQILARELGQEASYFPCLTLQGLAIAARTLLPVAGE